MKRVGTDPEPRLTVHAQMFKQLEPSPEVLGRIATRTRSGAEESGKRSGLWREFVLAAGLMVFVGTLAFGATYLRTLNSNAPAATAAAKPTAIPTASVSPAGPDTALKVAPSQVQAFLAARVKTVQPVLFVTAVPQGAAAYVTADANSFTVEYRTKTVNVLLATGAPNLTPGGTTRVFRGVQAVFQVTDPAAPQEGQMLSWTEPGASLSSGGTPYFLKVGGMTEAQFWQLANSIR